FSNNTTLLHPSAASDRDTRRAASAQVEGRSRPPVNVAPALSGPCSRTPTPAPPSAIADRSTSGETIPPPHWTLRGRWSTPSAIPGQLIIASANPRFAEANPPQSLLKATPKAFGLPNSLMLQAYCQPPQVRSPPRSQFWILTKNYFPVPPAPEPAPRNPLTRSPIPD